MTKHSALLLVGIQYDFPEGGAALAVNLGKIDGERVLDEMKNAGHGIRHPIRA